LPDTDVRIEKLNFITQLIVKPIKFEVNFQGFRGFPVNLAPMMARPAVGRLIVAHTKRLGSKALVGAVSVEIAAVIGVHGDVGTALLDAGRDRNEIDSSYLLVNLVNASEVPEGCAREA
jgi:hypothetical protein